MKHYQVYQINQGLTLPVLRRRPQVRAWYRRHRLALWLITDVLLLLGFYMMTKYIWEMTTPLVTLFKLIP